MTKKVAVLAVNPVNGCGLFQYLEAFFENGIAYKVFAVADSKEIKTNSGIALTADDVVANLKGHEDESTMRLYSLAVTPSPYFNRMPTNRITLPCWKSSKHSVEKVKS